MLNFCDFIQVFVFTTNHHLNSLCFYDINYNPSIFLRYQLYSIELITQQFLDLRNLAGKFQQACKIQMRYA